MKTRTYLMLVPALAVALLASGVPPVVAGQAIDEDSEQVIVVKTSGDSGDGEHSCVAMIAVASDNGEEKGVKRKVLSGGKGCALHTGAKAGPCFLVAGQPADPSRGWLGVSLSEVSPALAAQLDLDDGAVMIANVVEESPAEAAGLQRYDVFTAIDGEPVGDSVAGLAERIGELGAGTSANLGILRGGKAMNVNVTLGSRPDPTELQWVFEGVGPSISDKFHSRARVIMRGPDGNFEIKDLGDLKHLARLPKSVLEIIPSVDDITTQIWVDKGDDSLHTHITTRIEEDGQILEIEQKGGKITVRRTTTDDQGNAETTEETYESAEELEAADPEAYEVFSGIQGPHVIDLDLSGLSGLSGLSALSGLGRLNLTIDLEDLKKDQAQWRAELDKGVQEAQRAFEEAMKNVDRDAHFDWAFKFRPFLGPEGRFWASHAGEATQTFTVTPEGRIEVKLRKGDSEVIMVYEDEADLQARNPEMYEKYTDVTSAPVEE